MTRSVMMKTRDVSVLNKAVRTAYILIFIFSAVFAPPVLPFNILFVLAAVAAIRFHPAHGGAKISIRSVLKMEKQELRLLLAGMICLIWIVISILINQIADGTTDLLVNRATVLYQLIVLIPAQFLVAFYIENWMNRYHESEQDFVRIVLIACLIETVLVVAAYLSPAIRQVFLNSIMAHGGKAKTYANESDLAHRAYGWASTLLDTFGYGCGLLAGICLLYDKLGVKRYVWMLLFLFATTVNSRSGLAVFAIACAVWMLRVIISHKGSQWVRFLLFILAMAALAALVLVSGLIPDAVISWIIAGFKSIWNVFTGGDTSYEVGSVRKLFSARFWTVPSDVLTLVFGAGHSLSGTKELLGINSDVGYINYIWICGVFGMLLVMGTIGAWFVHAIRRAGTLDMKYIRIFLMIAFFVMMIKTNILTHSAGTFVTILFCIYKEKT